MFPDFVFPYIYTDYRHHKQTQHFYVHVNPVLMKVKHNIYTSSETSFRFFFLQKMLRIAEKKLFAKRKKKRMRKRNSRNGPKVYHLRSKFILFYWLVNIYYINQRTFSLALICMYNVHGYTNILVVSNVYSSHYVFSRVFFFVVDSFCITFYCIMCKRPKPSILMYL